MVSQNSNINQKNANYTNTVNKGTGGGPIISFLDCQNAGYTVQESYPRKCTIPEGEEFTEDIGNEIEMADNIIISSPRPNDVIVSPVEITGQAVGSWFFEGEFDIILYDVLGKNIAQITAQAESDWMTDDFINFTATLIFDNEAYGPGELHLIKANPSDIADYNDALIVPVDFGLYTN